MRRPFVSVNPYRRVNRAATNGPSRRGSPGGISGVVENFRWDAKALATRLLVIAALGNSSKEARFRAREIGGQLDCIHPYCPKGGGLPSWRDVAESELVHLRPIEKAPFVGHMEAFYAAAPSGSGIGCDLPPISKAALSRLLKAAPCLYNQVDKRSSAQSIIHFCELTLGEPITDQNAFDAFLVQHPKEGPPFNPGPVVPCTDGGTVMELLCSEILTNSGIPPMPVDDKGWPIWRMPGHVLLNENKMRRWKALGDVLVPCAPTNLIISVKTQAARERLLYSANSIEGVGFGFFAEAKEFWTVSRMTLLKRMGFTAIYMPDGTFEAVMQHLDQCDTKHHSININGRALYRPFSCFGEDMRRAVGRSSDEL